MNYKISLNKNENKQIEQSIKVLTSWMGEPDANSTRSLTFLTLQNNSAEIQKLNLEKVNKLKKIDDFLIISEKHDIQNKTSQIFLLARGDRGLANSIYYLYMKLKDQQIQDPFSRNWDEFETPYFETRGLTLNFPFRLEGLSTDTWSVPQWKEYLNRIRSFNYTSITFLIGSWMLYHPDFEELKKNAWRYDVAEEVFKYAAEIGLEIILLYVYNQIQTDLWINYPEIRAHIWGYQGISYCNQKGKEIGEKILTYTLNRFKSVPSVALFAFEGGGCNCEYCRGNVVELIHAYLDLMKEAAEPERLYFCTWFANFKENFETPAIKGLRDRLFATIPKEIKIIDVNRKTLQMAAAQGYEIFDFIFFIDPEAGMENQAIFPKPHLHLLKERITDSIQIFGPQLKGMFGYRIIPKARFINDYVLSRYFWNPEIEIDAVVSEVAGLLSSSMNEKDQITHAIQLLEEFWTTLDKNKLKECQKVLKTVTTQQKNVPEPLQSIRDTVIILNLLFKYYNHTSKKRKEGIIQKIFSLMKEMDIFHCYTTYNWWDALAIEIIKQRVQWWTDPKSGLFNPKSLPWNSLAKAKYHLIDNKKDVLPWMQFSEIVSSAKMVLSQKLKNFTKKLRKKK
ncbi:MAG TPA: hypothetical protein VMV49_17040 [Candidatus Deferrimicrobium sp.]|nr:hypothetical protein [Candidatus Deferrimicrobium sp.]